MLAEREISGAQSRAQSILAINSDLTMLKESGFDDDTDSEVEDTLRNANVQKVEEDNESLSLEEITKRRTI